MDTPLDNLPSRDWGKTLEYDDGTFKIFSVKPQAYCIGVTKPVGLLESYPMDAILVKAFEKNYKSPSRPRVVEVYGFERGHGEPIELVGFNYECIYDRATEAEVNRYRHNSKNYESGRYVDYLKHGLTVVIPYDIETPEEKDQFIQMVLSDFKEYARLLEKGVKKQQARRRLGFYVAVESVFYINLRSLSHMAKQRSHSLSPNGKEAEPQISDVVTQMVNEATPYLPHFKEALLKMVAGGYR